jgi:hypothetical protein
MPRTADNRADNCGHSIKRRVGPVLPMLLLCVTLWTYPLSSDPVDGKAVQQTLLLEICEIPGEQRFLQGTREFRWSDGTLIRRVYELKVPWANDASEKHTPG